ncbi:MULTISPECIES: LacI family DNA-binding transcriptional regulator [unclassified Leifsonia]|uniref:LacI family DNA-binding transcriptional regulator n=1 Tax=unclassified Leifsonia TaxID=2663824 RepID=UPI0008A74087|nr:MULTISPECIES: LacI family DNA-binding transcriptional regulator [unclassified Leifsonia]SEI10961.1 DNA-binding transcriptional regulator, LacI/PurR family [Leifsonia sp. CL154]SFL89875.1 DNA-binding transcriptional regulator, LacI/PurR family [Leifsonia sp. CL147]
MAVRLQDVAEHAGVSMKTVSNVVRNYAHVSPQMRERVQRAIDELGYRPNIMGRRLATGRTGLLALAFADVTLPYFAELARVVADEAERRGYRVLLEQTEGTIEGERAVVSAGESGLVDGMIFQPSVMNSAELAQSRTDIPLVVLGENAAPLTVDRIMIDNVEAARIATQHLLSQGRTRIAFAGHEASGPSRTSLLRIAGYQQALEDAGHTADPQLLIASSAVSAGSAVQAVGAAIDAGLRFDGLVCRDDLAAIGALRALQERDFRVPEDVAVTGWDNTPMTAVTYPSITSIAPDMRALATRAVDMLLDRVSGFDGMGRHELAPFSLVVRESAPTMS